MPFTLLPPPLTREDALTRRLDSIATRIRRSVTLRSASWLIMLTAIFLGGFALLDYRFQLPGLVRALGLAVYLIGLPLLFRRWILQPLQGTGDPIQIAMRVERAYPEFNDSLTSAIQFLQQEKKSRTSSPGLRNAAIRRASRKAERYEFERAVNSRYLKRSVFGALLAIVAVWLGVFANPAAARTALTRIVVPFGGAVAPTQTRINILSPQPLPHRMARGEPLDIRIALHGQIPDRVTLSIQFENSASIDQAYSVVPNEYDTNSAELGMRIEPSRIPRDFQFRIRANDADTGWQSVQVSPPPVLVPLDGRPSPQIHLDFPAYSDLLSIELPDGSGIIECVCGTSVTIRAATDRPVARAWIGYRPENATLKLLSSLSPLGANSEITSLGLQLLASEVWADVPVTLLRDGTLLEVRFIPRVPGPYALRFEDETGLGNTRMFDLRVQPDPAPTVSLERPSPSRESLLVLPDAEITFQARVADSLYAIRGVKLEYRTNKGGSVRSIEWFEASLAGVVLPATANLMRGPIRIPAESSLRLRYQQMEFLSRLSMTHFRHADGSPLIPGDSAIIQITAEDFDNVTGFKAPGRSHEIELLIVTKQDLEAVEQQGQSDLRTELLRLQALQHEARTHVQEAIQQTRNTGKLRIEDLDKLNRAEQTQQQIRERLNNKDDGIRAQLEKLRQSAKDNHLPRSAATDRLDDATAELARLAKEELEPLEADLATARRTNEGKDPPTAPLVRAEKRQKEVEQTLLSLLERLEPWSGAGEIRGEARSVLNELKRHIEKRDRVTERVPPNVSPEKLTPEQKAEVDREAIGDERLSERARLMIEKLNRLAIEKDAAVRAKLDLTAKKEVEAKLKRDQAGTEPMGSDNRKSLERQAAELETEAKQAREAAADLTREADALRNAANSGNSEQLKEQLRDAGQFTKQNQPSRAAAAQKGAASNLEKMLAALEEQKSDDSDRMGKKLKNADKELNELIEKQELLQKKVEAAEKLKNPEERKTELEKLSREQEKLEKEASELAQKLSRNQGERAADELRRAAREMANAREELENGNVPQEKIEDALERLDDAQRELDQAKKQNEEELLREQAAKFADELKAIRDREQRLLDESIRLHALVKKAGKWERPVRTSLNDLYQQQKAIPGELRGLIEKKFENAAVFGRMLRQAADAMDLAAKRIDSRLESAETGPFDIELEDIADAGIQNQQKLAIKRIDQLLEALKPDKQDAAAPMAGGMPPDMPPMDAAKSGDQLPPLAQLKALRSLQADITERTETFDKAHPDRTKLNDDEVAELELLQKMQTDIAELIKQLTGEMGK